MDRRSILVVDDEWDYTEILIFLLEAEGHHISHAPNGLVAFEKLMMIGTHTDLVVTDFTMPIMDGCELLRAMRASERLAAIPVLMLSALTEEVVRKKCNPPAFLHKPFRPDQLLTSVRSLLCY